MKPGEFPLPDALRPVGQAVNNAGGQMNPLALTTDEARVGLDAEAEKRKQTFYALRSAAPMKTSTMGKGG